MAVTQTGGSAPPEKVRELMTECAHQGHVKAAQWLKDKPDEQKDEPSLIRQTSESLISPSVSRVASRTSISKTAGALIDGDAEETLLARAEAGDTDAMFEVGTRYEKGTKGYSR